MYPDRTAHAALVTVVGLHLQQVRAARLSIQSALSSSDETRQKVYTELTTTVTYTNQTYTLLYIVKSTKLNPLPRIMGIYGLTQFVSHVYPIFQVKYSMGDG